MLFIASDSIPWPTTSFLTIVTLTIHLSASLILAAPHQCINPTIAVTVTIAFYSSSHFSMVIFFHGLARSPCDYSALAYFTVSHVLAFTRALLLFKTSSKLHNISYFTGSFHAASSYFAVIFPVYYELNSKNFNSLFSQG